MPVMTSGPGSRNAHEHDLPRFSHAINGWFMWYVRKFLRRHFHAVRLLRDPAGGDGHPDLGDEPVLIYTNHPGWWDPLVFLLVGATRYPRRMSYGPIDAAALGKYKFLERIGFIGIEAGTWRGSARFLRMARAALARSDVLFWVTAQGEFADPRRRPVEIRPGVGHAVAGSERGVVVPLAVEYPFWSERLPEALAAFGPARRIADFPGRSADAWTDSLAADLVATQDRLAAAAIHRDPTEFATLLSGRVGVAPTYDTGRRVAAWLRGRRFDPSHGGEGEAAS
jgi:1-acyl-sn-glycerol-3-phosphate acyltransferase